MTPAVDVLKVTCSYDGGPAVLSGFSVAVKERSVTAILGPNGVGKTTLLNTILGWMVPESGTVRIFGRQLREMSRSEAGRTVSIVPQDEHVAFEYSLLDYVMLGRSPHMGPLALPTERDAMIAGNALHQVGLYHRRNDPVTEISGGEKQLVLLARSLCQEPKLLLLDEASAHLDLGNKRRLADLITALKRDGVTILFTTHDPDFASMISDEIILLSDAGLLAQGTPREVMTPSYLSTAYRLPLSVRWLEGRPHILW